MICPFCNHDNIAGVDECAECGQSLTGMESDDSVLIASITRHTIDVLNPREPVVVQKSTPVRDVVRQMTDNRIGCLLVVDDGDLAGIITERDVLNKIADDLSNLDEPASEFMTADPMTIQSHDFIAYALHAMDLGGYRHMPIVNADGDPSGIISVRDILRFLCVRFADSRGPE